VRTAGKGEQAVAADGSLKGKVAIVTGAGRGLGRSIARALGEAGADVVVASRTAAELHAFVARRRRPGAGRSRWPTDVTDEQAVEALVERTVAHFGRVDVLVNNSGVLSTATAWSTRTRRTGTGSSHQPAGDLPGDPRRRQAPDRASARARSSTSRRTLD